MDREPIHVALVCEPGGPGPVGGCGCAAVAHWKAGRFTYCLLRGRMGPPRVFPGPKPPDDVALEAWEGRAPQTQDGGRARNLAVSLSAPSRGVRPSRSGSV